MTPRALIHAAVAAAGLLAAAEARAQGSLVLYCAVQEEWCRGGDDGLRARDRHQGRR